MSATEPKDVSSPIADADLDYVDRLARSDEGRFGIAPGIAIRLVAALRAERAEVARLRLEVSRLRRAINEHQCVEP